MNELFKCTRCGIVKPRHDYYHSDGYRRRQCIECKKEDSRSRRNVKKEGAEWQAKQSPWISVEDRLPEDGLIDPIAWNVTNSVVALTSNGNAIVTKRRWNCTLKTWEWKGSHTFVNSIVKWMPIPE